MPLRQNQMKISAIFLQRPFIHLSQFILTHYCFYQRRFEIEALFKLNDCVKSLF